MCASMVERGNGDSGAGKLVGKNRQYWTRLSTKAFRSASFSPPSSFTKLPNRFYCIVSSRVTSSSVVSTWTGNPEVWNRCGRCMALMRQDGTVAVAKRSFSRYELMSMMRPCDDSFEGVAVEADIFYQTIN